MEELTAGLLGTGMVMIAGGGGVAIGGNSGGQENEFSSPSPSYSSGSSISSSCSPTYYNNQILSNELFTEFEQFSAFELGSGGNTDNAAFLQHGSSDEERTYMEELISSDLSSDEDKFLETIRYGGGGVVHFSNDLLSEEELVNTIQTYGDVKIVQVNGDVAAVEGTVGEGIVDGVCGGDRVFEVVSQQEEKKVEGRSPSAGKKRKGSVGGGQGNKAVKRTLTIMQQQQQQTTTVPQQHAPSHQPKKQHHKQTTQPRVFEDEIIIETNSGELITADLLGSPSPGSPRQQQQDSNGTFQELKLSDEEKRLLMKEGISLPTHYPLTKLEERELKRIRRKIRNKISAQDSRKRKKEFLDKLQQKLQEVEDEKSLLQKRVRSLESINTKLNAQVKRLQQALASATSSVQNSVQQHQQKQNVVPAATTLLVLILSLALVVLPTSMDQRNMNGSENANEIISLLNRSNEMAREQGGRVLGGGGNDKKLSHPKSRTMVAEGEDEMDEDDIMDVRELIGQMKTLLRNKRKRGDVVGMVKRRRFDGGTMRGGGGGGLSGLLGVMKNGIQDQDSAGWWVSDDDDDENNLAKKQVLLGGSNGGALGGRFERKHNAFQIVDDVEVD